MEDKQLVTFKGKKNGIAIFLDREAPFNQIKESFAEKISETKDFFGDSKISVTFLGRQLSQQEKAELFAVINEKSSITAKEITKDNLNEPKRAASKSKTAPVPVIPDGGALQPFSQWINQTVFHKGSLRSGQNINHAGSIVVMGDVNPGAQLCAMGNIIVLGSVKGFVHAGSGGDESCYIAALGLVPTQIRIADIITYIPAEMKQKNRRQSIPSYAYVENGRIYIAEL